MCDKKWILIYAIVDSSHNHSTDYARALNLQFLLPEFPDWLFNFVKVLRTSLHKVMETFWKILADDINRQKFQPTNKEKNMFRSGDLAERIIDDAYRDCIVISKLSISV